MRGPRRAQWALLAMLPLLLAGCGSTVQVSGTAQLPGGGVGAPGSELGGSLAPGAGAAQGTTGAVSGSGASTGGVAGSGSSGTAGGSGSLPPGATDGQWPGVTATKVYIGFVQDRGAGALNSAVGVGSITSGDDNANTRAVIQDINRRGGLGGRQLVQVTGYFDQRSTQTYDQQLAAVCQQFTRDQPRVFAVVDAGVATATSYRDCLARAGVPIVSSSLPISNAATFARYPGYIELGSPNIDRLAAFEVPALVAQSYFTPWDPLLGAPAASGSVKVGVLTYDDRDFSHAVDSILVPALRRLGHDPVVERISQLSSASETGSQGASVKAAQLAFAQNNVTHVIPFETNGNLGTFFFPTARSQHYYPRYAVSTASAAEALLESKAVDPDQMRGAVGFGWIPSLDLRREDNSPAGPYSNDMTRYCLKVMKDNGITFTSGNAEGIALNTCSTLYLLKAAFDRAPKHVTLTSFLRTVEGLGRSYVRPGGIGLGFRPGRHDPADRAYYWHYVASCGCFRYYGPARTVP